MPETKGISMIQDHKCFIGEQVKVVLQGCCQGNLSQPEIDVMLGIGKTRFFSLLKGYRRIWPGRHLIDVLKVDGREDVNQHLVLVLIKNILKVRI